MKERVWPAFGFALLTCGAQVAAVIAVATASAAIGAVSWVFCLPALILALPLSLGLAPLAVHGKLSDTRWRPSTSLQATVVFSLVGLALGYLLGAVFLETGHVRGGGIGSAIGGLLGSFMVLFVANLDSGRV